MNLSYPFNLISGKGLGVSYSSLTQIGPALPSRDFGLLPIQSFVNVFTGNLILFDYKCVLPDKNIPLEFYYVYNSHATIVDTIWRLAHKYFKKLPSVSSPLAILVEVDGHETPYQFDSQSNRWQAPYWSESRPYLTQDPATEQWRWFDPQTQITEVYNQHGCLIERLNRKNESTWYSYSPTQTGWRLRKISTLGADYEFRQYFIKGQRYESIHHIYLHKETLLKTSVFDIEGRLLRTYLPKKGLDSTQWPQVNYTYKAPSDRQATQPSQRDVYVLSPLAKIEQNDGSYCSFVYNTLPHFAPRTLAQFNYQHVTDTGIVLANFFYHSGQTIIENYAKVATKLYFNPQGSITQIDRENGYPLTPSHTVDSHYYTYHPSGQLASHTSANQGSEHFYYEQNEGRLIKHEQANGLITQYYYDSTSVKRPLIAMAESDAINGQTQVTRNVYDVAYDRHAQGLYLRFKISPEGRVTEYRLEAPGFVEYTIHYCEARFPVESYPQEKAPNRAEMLTWIAQQDPQKISLTKCQYDNSGQPAHTYYYGMIDEQGKGREETQRYHINTRYTLFGDLSQRSEYRDIEQNPLRTQQKFDQLRRILFTRNAAQETTTYAYDNNHRRVVITRPNGRQDITEWDTRGWINKKQQRIQNNQRTIIRETTFYRRIVSGSTEKCLTLDGQFSYQFYDKQNRLGVTVDTNGRLTEYRYDVQHRYKLTIEYAHPIDTEKLAARPLPETEPTINDLFQLMKEMVIADPEQDRMHYAFYDTSGRLIYEVDPEKYWQQSIYNAWDNVVTKIAYATPLSLSALTSLLEGNTLNISVDPQQDRIQRTFYDHDQQIIGIQDAAGYVTEYKRNAAGWIIETIHYQQPQVLDLQTQDVNQIRPPAHPQDTHDYHFYNARGWIILAVDAEGYLSTRDYLLNGLVLSEKYYANPVDTSWYANTTVIPTLPSDSPEDRTIHYEYDVLNREIIRRQSDGKEWFTDYDTMGHVSAQGIRDTHATEINGDTYRATQYQFDGWEQTIAEASVWNSETLAQIEANTHLTADEKQTQRATIWREQTQRHTYEISGLKVATAMRPSPTADDQLRYFYLGLQRQTLYHYNHLGYLTKTIDPNGIVIENKYDQRDLVIAQCLDPQKSGLNLMTIKNYNGQRQQIEEILGNAEVSNQYQRQFNYDALSRQCATIVDPITDTHHTALNLVTQQHKNGKDRVIAEIDANGHWTRFLFDTSGRHCFTINPLRGITEWQYNATDQRIVERQYQHPLTEDHVAQLNDETTPDTLRALLQPSTEDTITYWFYDANGKPRFILSDTHPNYIIQEKRYDAVQREIQTIQYATPILLPNLAQLTTEQITEYVAKITDATQDRCVYFLYDAAGQIRFTIDPQRCVSEQRFDEQGRVISQIGYAHPVDDPESLSRCPLSEVLTHLKPSTQDRYQFFYFDHLGQPTYTVHEEGQVVRYQHDAKGNLIEEVHFQQRVEIPQAYSILFAQLQALTPDSTHDRMTQKKYDAANRVIQQTDPLGYTETYQWDALGNRVTYIDRQQSPWKTEFDRAKRPVLEMTPEITFTEVTQEESGLLVSIPRTLVIEKQKQYDAVGNIRRIVSGANTNEPRIFEVAYNGLNQWQKNHLPDIAVDNASPLQPTNWRYRPETKQTLTTTRKMNAKGLRIAEQDAAGHLSFWVYDNQKRLVYTVNSLGVTTKKERDAFGKIHRKTMYATPCSLDLSRYTTTGIPKSVLDSYYRTHTSDQDRVIIMQRDQLGRVILQHQGPTYCYSEHPTRTIHSAYTEIKKTYNPWGKIIAQREKVDRIRQKEQFYWFDRQGQCLAEVDNIGFDSQTPRYRCRRFERNPFKQVVKRVAYAKTLDLVISSDWSFAQLEHTLTGLISPHDRCEEFNYDHADRLIKKHVNKLFVKHSP